jgi:hypothetical protein
METVGRRSLRNPRIVLKTTQRRDDRPTESSDDSGYVKELPLIFVLQQLSLHHEVAAEVE